MEHKTIEDEYKKIVKKFELPKFDILEKEFGIGDIEETPYMLREIRKRVEDKVDDFTKIIESILQPDTGHIASLHECKFFNDNEKEDMFNLFKELMKLNREGLKLDLEYDEKEEAEFLKNIVKHWEKIKTKMEKIVKKLKDAWDADIEKEQFQGYFG